MSCPDLRWPGNRMRAFLDTDDPTPDRLDSYGNVIQGQRDQSGLLFRRNRYYDPLTGQFTQEDPIGLAGGVNLYGFAGGDPVNLSDPFGLMECEEGEVDVDPGEEEECRPLLTGGEFLGDIVGGPLKLRKLFSARKIRGAFKAIRFFRNRRAISGLLRPSGELIGVAGRSGDDIRVVAGGADDASRLFGELVEAGGVEAVQQTTTGIVVRLRSGGNVGFRIGPTSTSPNTAATIDVNLPGFDDLRKIKFELLGG